MKLHFDARPARKGDVVVRFVSRDERAKISPLVSDAEFSGNAGALLHQRHEDVLCAGIGERGRLDAVKFRVAAGAAALYLRKIGRTRCSVDLDLWPQFAGAAVEGLVLGAYRFERFKAKPGEDIASIHIRALESDLPAVKRAGARAQIVADATNLARSIANEPGNLLYPATLAERARKLAKSAGLKIKILDERQLRAGGFGGLLAVGGGSERGPRLIVLDHRGGPKGHAPIALVGKAITFDSGGISIKPAADMEAMIFDKCGGMAVLGAMAGIAGLGLKCNVVGIVPSAENLPSGTAYRPGDIVTAYDGKHIEIVNTDAEGRVVLADAIAYSRLDCRAAAIVDLATLTGACGIALGEHAAGFWSSDEELRGRVLAAAASAGERIWEMPLFAEYDEQIQSGVALVKNSGGRLGGACTAAAFLKTFAEATPWAHLDIARMVSRTERSRRPRPRSHRLRSAHAHRAGCGLREVAKLPGSTRVSRVGRGVPPRRTSRRVRAR